MVSVTFSVGTPLAYRVRSLELPGLVHQIQAEFEDGSHTFTSSDFQLGTVHSLSSRSLIGRLSFRYSYQAANRVITVCGTDFASGDGMTLITMPEGTDYAYFEHAASAGFTADQSGPWNYRTQLMPGAAQVINSIARGANDALISALEATPDLVVQVRKSFPELPMEHYLNLCVVYRGGRFLELFDHSHQYEPDDEVHAVDSVWGGEVTLNKGENFANVIGSTSDPKVAGLSWIQLWARQFGMYPTTCESFNYGGFPCGTYLVGGHIVLGKKAMVMAKGSNAVYIVPICAGHNNNDNVYMAALTYPKGVWLKNYLGP
jgi:hypothetical protein